MWLDLYLRFIGSTSSIVIGCNPLSCKISMMKWLFPRIFYRVQAGWHSETETTVAIITAPFFTPVRLHSQNLVSSSRFWTPDHRWWSNWFIKTISRRFISQETEQKWLVRPPQAFQPKPLDAENSFPLWATGLLSSAWPWRLTLQCRYQNISHQT